MGAQTMKLCDRSTCSFRILTRRRPARLSRARIPWPGREAAIRPATPFSKCRARVTIPKDTLEPLTS